MNTDNAWRTIEVIPTLEVADLAEAEAFYGRLGFKQDWTYPPGESPTHVGLGFDRLSIMLSLAPSADKHIERQIIYFVLENLDAYREQVSRKFEGELPPVIDSDYGMRDFTLTDPWGHLLTFGEP